MHDHATKGHKNRLIINFIYVENDDETSFTKFEKKLGYGILAVIAPD